MLFESVSHHFPIRLPVSLELQQELATMATVGQVIRLARYKVSFSSRHSPSLCPAFLAYTPKTLSKIDPKTPLLPN